MIRRLPTLLLLAALGPGMACTTLPKPPAESRPAIASTSPTVATPEPTPAPPLTCFDRTPDVCIEGPGCVLDGTGGCRDAANDCERVVPLTNDRVGDSDLAFTGVHGRVTFATGKDPCEAVDPTCAWDPRTRLCQPFELRTECPATVEEARALRVACSREDQSSLRCHYTEPSGTTFECETPFFFLGGIKRPDGYYDRPREWTEQPDYDDQGCPVSSVAFQARCDKPPSQKCVTRFDTFVQCIRHRWEQTGRLPARP